MLRLKPAISCRYLLGLCGMSLAAAIGISSQAYAQCTNPPNQIVAENCLQGTPASVWDINGQGGGDLTIQGFATDMSVNVGGTIYFKIDTPASSYSIDIYRMGYYQGNGARYITSIAPSVKLPQAQPACVSDSTTGITDCGNWAVTASWTVPTNAVSGIYFAHLTRSDTGGDSQIVFVVRNDAGTSAILYQTSDATWQAYNYYGNGSLYGPNGSFNLTARAYGVSYNRPVLTRGFDSESATFVFGAEYAMVQWLEANGYDVSYFSGVDTARYGSLILNHKIFMDCGHDEYVSGPARANITAARDAGVNVAFFSGNEIFWKTRWANSIDGSNAPYRTMMCYKETLAFAKLDPADPPTWTGTWRDPTFSPPADGGVPENALTGTLFMVNGPGTDNGGDLSIAVPQADGQMRFWRNTAVASLAPGKSYTLVPGSLGYEWDADVDNGFRPAGAFHLSTTTAQLTTDLLLDYGGTYGAGTATHHMMMYRAQSGALVFGAGSVDWAFGLNNNHDNPFDSPNPNPDINMEQAVVNLFADMGVQPASIQPGLAIASASTDTTPPHSVITNPTNGSTVNTGSTVAITGTASDAGGVVAGVEVSWDGGKTWHPAAGRTTWSYSWTPTVAGQTTLLSRAVDDSGNLEIVTGGVTLNVAPQNCPCTIFGQSTPINSDSGDSNAIEVGLKFRADADGSILGVRFYKSTANTGTHLGHIWTDAGTLLGSMAFTSETASGWQEAHFSSPIAATANTVYVVSYFAPNGHYAGDSFAFDQAGVDNPPLHALANGVDGGNGLYLYTSAGGFPASTFNSGNYWVDVVYSSSNTYTVSGNVSGIGGAGAAVALVGPENLTTTTDGSGNFLFDGVVNGAYTVSVSNPGVSFTPPSQTVQVNFAGVNGVNFVATVNNPLSISGTIMLGEGATVTLGGPANESTTTDASGNYSFTGLLSGSYTVTPSQPGYIYMPSTKAVTLSGTNVTGVNFQGQLCTCISIWPSTATPATVDSGDSSAVELGLVFTADSPAYLTGVRFYKASTNLGQHVGHLWSSSGQLLGTATFPSETAAGWQQGYFATPVFIDANTAYIVSYLAPQGHYSLSTSYFASSGVDSPPLHAPADGVHGPNGLYVYTPTGAFPTNGFSSTNYWVDVLYAAETYNVSGTISGTGGAGASVVLTGNMSATTTADANGNFAFQSVYGGTYSVIPSNPGYVFLPGAQTVSVSQSDVTGVNFSVPQSCPCYTVWKPSTIPAIIDSADPGAVETGVKVQSNADGYILGLRFYKSPANQGSHVGNLWSLPAAQGAGDLLSTATFVNETDSGWQQVMFANPVPIVANTPYVASYFSPMGHYSANSAYFATTGTNSPPLLALQDGDDGGNGVFSYSSASTYPANTYNSDNYWVDVIYAATGTYTIAGTISGPGAAGASVVLGGAGNASTTTDANGNFSFSGLADGTYTVTPTESGFIFTPGTLTVTINGGHALAQNFSSAIQGFAVSGTVAGAPGITVSLSGTTTQTTVADASGNFNFSTVPNGTYTVTPASAGFAVSPTSRSVTVNGGPATGVNFTASVVYYSITGTITGGAGVTVSLSGTSTATTTADSAGNYSFSNVTVGNYVVTPSISEGVVFSPASQIVVMNGTTAIGVNFAVPQNCPCDTIWPSSPVPATVDSDNSSAVEVGLNFTASADAYITGLRFYKAIANTGTHVGHIWTSSGTLLGTATFTNESPSGWQQVLFAAPVPVKANTTYVASYFAPEGHDSADLLYFAAGVNTPPLQALANTMDAPNGVYLYSMISGFPNNADGNAINYWVDVIYTPTSTYSVTGNIAGPGAAGAMVTFSGAGTGTTTTDDSGNFSISGLANGDYVITPTQTGFAYSPPSQNVSINDAHVLGLSFNSAAGNFAISGTISGPGGNGATVTLSGASSIQVTATPTGTYSLTGLANGTYSVVISNAGYVFTPASQSVTLNGANATANFSSTAQTYTISGTISGPGGNGATLTLSGAASASTIASTSGTFSFTGLANGGTYTVGISNPGYVFTPASQSVTVSGSDVALSFSSAVQTYNISGTISGPGGNGATVTLSGAASAATTASTSGTFSFTGLANGTYTVAVSNTGYVFTPVSQIVTVNGASATANFSSAAQTYTISGTISGPGGNGATVTLSGSASASTTASTSGTFSFTGLANGTYTVAASNTGYVFTPVSQVVTVNGASATANFNSAAQTYTISGTISGPGGNGATVTLSGSASGTTTANASGVYSFTAKAGSYTITPTRTGFIFTPPNQTVAVSTSNVTANFTSAQTFTLSGTISGAGRNGATVTLSGAASATTTTNGSGAYSFTVLAGSYTVTPTKSGYVFTPASLSVTVTTANVTANFNSAVQTFTISGTITGPGASSATVRLTGSATATTTTNTSGAYSFTVATGSYTVTPSKSGFVYTPVNQAVTVTNANMAANFSSVQTFTISGTISGVSVSGVSVKLAGAATATATTNNLGAYSFTGLLPGSYTVTPSKTGFAYTPASQAVTITSANVTANFTSIRTFSISGTISGPGGNGATVTLSGAANATSTASATGTYAFSGLLAGTYTVTPSKAGHTYTPASRTVTINTGNLTTVNFSSN